MVEETDDVGQELAEPGGVSVPGDLAAPARTLEDRARLRERRQTVERVLGEPGEARAGASPVTLVDPGVDVGGRAHVPTGSGDDHEVSRENGETRDEGFALLRRYVLQRVDGDDGVVALRVHRSP